MKQIALSGLALAAMMAAGAGGYWVGDRGIALPDTFELLGGRSAAAEATVQRSGPVIYYGDPDGRPVYSAVPRRADDGREFVAVQASEDVSFDRTATASADAAAPAGSEAVGPRRILYYRNPMGLADTSPVPKKDSMGMDYIAVYEGEDTGGSVVRISAGRLQQTGVRTEVAMRQPVGRPVLVPGTVQLDERRIAVVATRSDAFIEKVANVTTGDRVTIGQSLIRLYSPEIAAAAAQYLTELKIDTGSARLGGARQRLENLGVPTGMIAEIERTRRVPLTVTWTAPRDGIVLERNVAEGMKAATGDVLFRLADIGTVWVLADVPEYELGSIRIGARATVRVRSQAGMRFEGQVSLIYPEVSMETRTTRVRIEISNPDGVLLPNMYAEVEIASGGAEPVVTVSDSAVIDTGTRQVVILDRGEGRFEPREVTIGRRGRGLVEIRDGVNQGDRVVVSANFLIDAESNLKAALSTMAAPEVVR
ncbi:efflux RND transporter periplasmic adaptor subunit [Thalassobaculum sp.]|uniref:efflux RND transporter periplasmic adaptor subunit n=1 Tax=Thalassobaculum sp. TaxID=2022740 RepID=UPI0032EE7FA3